MAAAGAAVHDSAVRLRAGKIAFAGSIVILGAKLAAWTLTGSAAVLSDALESFVNVAAGAILLASLRFSAQPADRNHPYGHGKVEFFSAGVEATLIAVAAMLICNEAIRAILAGPVLHELDLGLVLLTAATAGNLAIGAYLIRVGRRANSLALLADGRHLLTDVATSVGVLVGLLLVRMTDIVLLDPLVALAVAGHILFVAFQLAREAVRGLMDEAEPDLLGGMVEALEDARKPWCIDSHSLRAWRSGAIEHVDMHMVVPRYYDADRLHDIADEVEQSLLAASGRPGEAIVHFDPCRPRHCPGCAMEDCPVRAAPFGVRRPLTLERATRADETLDSGAPVAPFQTGE
jgi:cation diffusion facilitator family transporter